MGRAIHVICMQAMVLGTLQDEALCVSTNLRVLSTVVSTFERGRVGDSQRFGIDNWMDKADLFNFLFIC